MVFYRKWRPQTLAEVVGQEHVTRTLLNALTTGRVSHAYLFCGPRGTGKTSTGRILAKAVNCTRKAPTGKTTTKAKAEKAAGAETKAGKGEPCNECAMCKAITEGRALDVIEIDAASHTSVDDVRQLIERINYAPAEAKYKVYIIDEVHMISPSASNALLKTLEEPPPNIIFILATTETHKVLPTIVSRCQRFDFHRLSLADTEEKLKRITEAEHIDIAPEAMRAISRSARGGLRDAENLLEQLYTFYGPDIKLEQVHALLGMGGGERARELIKCLTKNDLGQGLQTINRAQTEGLDLRQLNRDLVGYLHGMLLIKSGVEKDADLGVEELTELKALAQTTPLPMILKSLKLFGEAQRSLGEGSLPMELALADALLEAPAAKPASTFQAEPEKAVLPRAAAAAPPPVAARPNTSAVPPMRENVPAPGKPAPASRPIETVTMNPPVKNSVPESFTPAHKPDATKPAFEPPPGSVPGAVPLSGNPLEQLRNSWRHIIEQAPDNLKRSPAVAILRSAGVQPISVDDGVVTLSFKHNFHKEKIEEIENRRVVSGLLSQFLGHQCQVKCVYEPAENHLVREAQKLGAQVTGIEDKY